MVPRRDAKEVFCKEHLSPPAWREDTCPDAWTADAGHAWPRGTPAVCPPAGPGLPPHPGRSSTYPIRGHCRTFVNGEFRVDGAAVLNALTSQVTGEVLRGAGIRGC